MKRRDFLSGTAALTGLGVFSPSALGSAQITRPRIPIHEARNVVFFVYDGFSWEDFAAAQHYANRHQGRTLALQRLLSLGTCGSMMTQSLTSIVTDSAAASTAWATGRRTANSNIGIFPDGQRLTAILELAKARGRATGLITTTRVTHATPAGFVAHILDRNDEDAIALQYLEAQPDVVLGGGTRHFDAGVRADGRDLFGEFAAEGYSIARTTEDLQVLQGPRMLGTFTSSHLPYEIDRIHQGSEAPSLEEMTHKGLQVLSRAPDGFFAQVEAGRIDHANHNNDPAAMVWEVLAADKALEIVLDFADRNPETLVILASDHGTGGGAIYGVGDDYHWASKSFDRIARRQASYEFILERLGSSPRPRDVAGQVAEYLKIQISEEDAGLVADAIHGNSRLSHSGTYHQQPENSLAWVIAEVENYEEPNRLNINYSAGQHTAGPVPIALYGAGTSEAQLGLVDNTEIFGWMCRALGTRYENPLMSEKEALNILADRISMKESKVPFEHRRRGYSSFSRRSRQALLSG